MDLSPGTLGERRLEVLRQWAWERGRTDVVGRLDTRAAALAFVSSPSIPALARLHDQLPLRSGAGWVEAAVRLGLRSTASPAALSDLARNLSPWLVMLGWQLIADLDEMAGGEASPSGSVPGERGGVGAAGGEEQGGGPVPSRPR